MDEEEQINHLPMYLQIAEQIKGDILSGKLPDGAKLPAERTLSAQLHVARGTVRAAYQSLRDQNFITAVSGSGIYVQRSEKTESYAKVEKLLNALWTAFKAQGLSDDEMEDAIIKGLWERCPILLREPIAWTECNPELLFLTAQQIRSRIQLPVHPFLLQEILNNPSCISAAFSQIAVPIGHVEEVQSVLPNTKIIRIAMEISKRTISHLSSLREDRSIAIIYKSQNFLSLVHRNLNQYNPAPVRQAFHLPEEIDSLIASHEKFCGVIIPMLQEEPPELTSLKLLCQQKNIRIIPFEFLLDNGSLMYLKECAQKLWAKRLRGE